MLLRFAFAVGLVALFIHVDFAVAKKPDPPDGQGHHDTKESYYFFLITGIPAATEKFKKIYETEYSKALTKYCWDKKYIQDIVVPNTSSEMALGFLCDPVIESVAAVSDVVTKTASNPPGGQIEMQYSTTSMCGGLHCTKHNPASTNCIKYTCWSLPQCHHNGFFCSDACVQ